MEVNWHKNEIWQQQRCIEKTREAVTGVQSLHCYSNCGWRILALWNKERNGHHSYWTRLYAQPQESDQHTPH